MLLFVCLIVGVVALDPRELEQGLQSAEGQVKLFSSWMKQEHNQYASPQEKSFRFRVFRGHLKEIVASNAAQDMYTLDANFMAGLTDEEQKQYYGINASLSMDYESGMDDRLMGSDAIRLNEASAIDWRTKGAVGPVKNQGSCGSCWTFGGTASFEGHYAVKTSALKRFAEQEMLDCTYEKIHVFGDHNGCEGGWYWHAFDMIKLTQHFSLEKDYPYKAKDNRCDLSNKKNGMVAAKSLGTARPKASRNDGTLVTALNVGPVAMAFEIKGGFSYYKSGILSVKNCGSTPHHAMAVTGYTSAWFQVKNSWGGNWGDSGYVKFDRRIENMCGISNWMSYPILEKTGDDVTDPTDGPKPDPACEDKNASCNEWASRDPSECTENYSYMGVNCKKSCGICGCTDSSRVKAGKCAEWKGKGYCEKSYTAFMKVACSATCGFCEASKCPVGLKFCGGKCQHEHFCTV